MPPDSGLIAAALLASIAFAGLAIALIVALIQVRRTTRVAEQTMSALEREIRPLAEDLRALLREHRALAQQAGRDLKEIEAAAGQAREVLGRVARLTSVVADVRRIGWALGLAQGVGRGAAVFVRRLGWRRR